MALTPEQKTAITAKLSVSLSTLTDDKLIELCLLYRSAPEALPTFPTLLATEITRRFTAAEIAANDVMFSVIQNFSNQFNPELQYKEKLFEFVNALNRELWINQNITFFENLITVTDRVTWAVNNSDVMTAVAASSTAMTAVVSSSTAMTAVVSSSTAMTAVAASSTAMTAVAASTTAMPKIVASSTSMTAVAASSIALTAILNSTPARNALMSNNITFQAYRVQVYNTVKASWVKSVGVISVANASVTAMTEINNAVVSPLGFVFASLGHYGSSYSNGISNITHPNGVLAASKGTSAQPTSLANLDAISFNSSTFKASVNIAQAYAELWSPT